MRWPFEKEQQQEREIGTAIDNGEHGQDRVEVQNSLFNQTVVVLDGFGSASPKELDSALKRVLEGNLTVDFENGGACFVRLEVTHNPNGKGVVEIRWAGDSRAVLFDNQNNPTSLTVDHNIRWWLRHTMSWNDDTLKEIQDYLGNLPSSNVSIQNVINNFLQKWPITQKKLKTARNKLVQATRNNSNFGKNISSQIQEYCPNCDINTIDKQTLAYILIKNQTVYKYLGQNPEQKRTTLKGPAVIVVASDGLWDNVSYKEISRILKSPANLTKQAATLIEQAKENIRKRGWKGKPDDVSVAIIQI